MTRQYRLIANKGFWHLGSVEGGYRTACGHLLKPPVTVLDSKAGVSCLQCGRTIQYRTAVVTGQISDDLDMVPR